MIREIQVPVPNEYRAESGDVVQIETQYDERRGTVLYIHFNGTTVLRIQNLDQMSQLHPRSQIEMNGREDPDQSEPAGEDDEPLTPAQQRKADQRDRWRE